MLDDSNPPLCVHGTVQPYLLGFFLLLFLTGGFLSLPLVSMSAK